MQVVSDIAECIRKEQCKHEEGTGKFRDVAMIQYSFAKLIFLWKYLNGCN